MIDRWIEYACAILLCAVIGGTCGLTGAQEPAGVAISIDADAAGGQLVPLFRDFAEGGESNDPDYLEGLIDELRALRPRMLRLDNVLNAYVRLIPEGDGYRYDFAGFDKVVSVIREMGAEPLICLSYTPEELARGGDPNAPPNDLREWEDVVYALVRHANREPARRILYWEVWNEPNHAGFWFGTRDEYLALYEATVRAALRADPAIRIGGGGYAGYDEPAVDALLDFVAARELRLDFLSWHLYYVDPGEYARTTESAQAKLAARGLEAELILDEWNYHAGLVPENDNHVGAAYVSEALCHMLDTALDYAPFFEPKDGWGPACEFWGRWGMFTFHETPKANYYGFLAWSRLAEERIALRCDDPRIGGVATRDGERIVAVLYSRRDDAVRARLRVAGCTAPAYRLTRWLVDRTHSNPVYRTPRTLERVERATCFAEGAACERDVLLPAHSVSLVELRPDPDQFPAEVAWSASPVERPAAIPQSLEAAVRAADAGFLRVWAGTEEEGDRVQAHSERAGDDRLSVRADHRPALRDEPGWRFLQLTLEKGDRPTLRFFDTTAVYLPARLEVNVQPERLPAAPGAKVTLHVANHGLAPVSARLRWEAGGGTAVKPEAQSMAIEARSAETATTVLTDPGELDEAVPLVAAPETGDGYRPTRTCMVAPLLEVPYGRMKPRTLAARRFIWSNFERVELERQELELGLAWDRQALRLRVSVPDETHISAASAATMFSADSVQLALDTGFDARSEAGYDENDFEYGMGLVGERPAVWCWIAGAGRVAGPVDDVSAAMERTAGVTVYDWQIPWKALGTFEPREGAALGFSLLVNDEDGEGRQCVSLFGDISGVKDPSRFGALVLRR